MKKMLLSILLFFVVLLGITGCGTETVDEDRQTETQDYGSVARETADVLVAKFNAQVVDNSTLNPASDDYLTTDENAYWYGLITGVYLIVYPIEFTGDLSSDIVDYMVLYVEKNSKFTSYTNEYLEYLIKANNPNITTEEVSELIAGAIDSADAGTTVNNGNGIDIGYVEDEETYQYQVIRLYE